MKFVGLVQIFCPVKETNRTHSQSYVEDLSTQCGQKRCAKMARLNLSVLPILQYSIVKKFMHHYNIKKLESPYFTGFACFSPPLEKMPHTYHLREFVGNV